MTKKAKRPRLYVFSHNCYASAEWARKLGLTVAQIFHVGTLDTLQGLPEGESFVELPSATLRNDHQRVRDYMHNALRWHQLLTYEQVDKWIAAQRPAFAQ